MARIDAGDRRDVNRLAKAWAAAAQTGEELTNRRFGRTAPTRPPNPPRRACTAAAQAAGVTYIGLKRDGL
jgi:hypothetical protein